MLQSSVRFLVNKSFPKGSVNKYFNSSVYLHKIPKVNFSTTKAVRDLEYFEGVISRPIMATPNDSAVIRTNPKDYSGKIPDDVWLSKAKMDQFSTYLPGIIDELAAKSATFSALDKGNRIRRTLEYIMPGGNRYCGVMTAETYKILTPDHQQTPENLKLACYLGWCFEIVLEALNISDDMLDVCQTRRNRLCWHELPDVGPSAVNDAFIIEGGAYYLLRKFFGNLECYTTLLELFNESTFLACTGQHVDMITSRNFEKLTIETYQEIVAKISVYLASFLPVALGMTLAGYTDLHAMNEAKTILADIGYFYIIQNDFCDQFGDPNVMGKVGVDIQVGRCRWPALIVLQLGTEEQKETLRRNYGREEPECVEKVVQLYKDINLPKIYEDYCNSFCNRVYADVDKLKNEDVKKICEKLAEAAIYAMHKQHVVYI